MKTSNFKNLKNGLYRIYWMSGGQSLASVGFDQAGNKWYAPTNWSIVPSFDWNIISSVELIDPKYMNLAEKIIDIYTKGIYDDIAPAVFAQMVDKIYNPEKTDLKPPSELRNSKSDCIKIWSLIYPGFEYLRLHENSDADNVILLSGRRSPDSNLSYLAIHTDNGSVGTRHNLEYNSWAFNPFQFVDLIRDLGYKI